MYHRRSRSSVTWGHITTLNIDGVLCEPEGYNRMGQISAAIRCPKAPSSALFLFITPRIPSLRRFPANEQLHPRPTRIEMVNQLPRLFRFSAVSSTRRLNHLRYPALPIVGATREHFRTG